MTFTTYGALIALAIAVVMILRKVTPAYALIIGALIGGIIGGGGLEGTVQAMISGTQSMMPSVIRILTSGILAGTLVKTGSAEKIADAIVGSLGSRFAVAAVALATMIVTAVGVFVDIAVITVAPVALAVGRRAGIQVGALLVAMVGGGKAGNIISPNPNTIAVADAFKLDLTALMMENIVPAVCAFAMTVLIAGWLSRRNRPIIEDNGEDALTANTLPKLGAAIAGPVAVIALLSLRPLFSISVDPLIALPVGGAVSAIACGKWRKTVEYSEYGLSKVIGVAVLLIGTGTVAGIVKGSGLNGDIVHLLQVCNLPEFLLAPISGVLLSGATASTTAGATIAAQTFAGALVESGVPAVSAAAMLHAGSTIFDALPHGSFFHATAGAVGISVKERLRLFPYGTLVGATSTICSTIWYLIRN